MLQREASSSSVYNRRERTPLVAASPSSSLPAIALKCLTPIEGSLTKVRSCITQTYGECAMEECLLV